MGSFLTIWSKRKTGSSSSVSPIPTYDVCGIKKCVLISNVENEDLNISVDKLERSLNNCGFDVTRHRHLSEDQFTDRECSDKIKNVIEAVNLDQCSVFFVILIAIGKEDSIYGSDEKITPIENVESLLHKEALPNFVDKPKVLLYYTVEPSVPLKKNPLQFDGGRNVDDLLVASLNGAQFTTNGLQFRDLDAFAEALNVNAKTEEFSQILRKICKRVSESGFKKLFL